MIAPIYVEHRGNSGLGYTPGGHLGYMPGSFMGDISADEMDTALIAGIPQGTMNALQSAGATDADIEDILIGAKTPDEVLQQYLISTGTGISQPAAGAGQVPNGSRLLYTASWPGLDGLPAGVISKLNSALAKHALSITDQSITGYGLLDASSVELTISDGIGHQFLTDVQSILDNELIAIVGNNLLTHNLSIIAVPGQVIAPGAAPSAASFLAWAQQNAVWIAVFGVAIFLGPGLIKKL